MYLYRCRLLYSKAIFDFYSNNYYQLSKMTVVKVETKHGVDLAIYLNKSTSIDDKEFDEIINYQAINAEENIENLEVSQDFIENGDKNEIKSKIGNEISSLNASNVYLKDQKDRNNNNNNTNNHQHIEKDVRKRQIRIEGKFLGSATPEDLRIYKENEEKAKEAFTTFQKEIDKFKLSMKPVGVHYFLDGMKILFDFVADHRIDFRELVKSLASIYRKRIELHQIGVRDEARMIDGIFICGQQLCCRRFLHQLEPISIKMAEVQNAPLNTMKISGYCGRLLCCLAYESDQYEEAKKNLPDLFEVVIYNNEEYIISEVNIIKQYMKLKKKDSIEYLFLKNEPLMIQKNEDGKNVIIKSEIYNFK